MSDSELEWAWLQQDALRPQDFNFSPEQRQRVIDEFKSALDTDTQDRLLAAVAQSVSYYLTWARFANNLAVDGDAKKMRRLLRQLETLRQTLTSLDWGTRRAVAPFFVGQEAPSLPLLHIRKPTELIALDEKLVAIYNTLIELEVPINRYLAHLKKRRPPMRLHDILAVEIADNLQAIVPGAVDVVTTRGGSFENIVAACLQAAGVNITDVHDIVLRAVPAHKQVCRASGGRSPPL
jgi:hypothetical protein